jgi:hypothetical protein
MQRILVRTPYAQLDDAMEQLSGAVAPERITLLWDAAVAMGEWVGFCLTLVDGTPVLEGSGMCEEMVDLGEGTPGPCRYRLVLTQLDLDPDNALVHDRIVRARFRAAARRSVVPPQRDPFDRGVVQPPRDPAPRSAPPPATQGAPRVFGRPSEHPPEPGDPHDRPTLVGPAPKPLRATVPELEIDLDPLFEERSARGDRSDAPPPRRPGSHPPKPEPLALQVPPALAYRAERLIPRLVQIRGVAVLELPSTEGVLRHALRVGLAALEAQIEASGEPSATGE